MQHVLSDSSALFNWLFLNQVFVSGYPVKVAVLSQVICRS